MQASVGRQPVALREIFEGGGPLHPLRSLARLIVKGTLQWQFCQTDEYGITTRRLIVVVNHFLEYLSCSEFAYYYYWASGPVLVDSYNH